MNFASWVVLGLLAAAVIAALRIYIKTGSCDCGQKGSECSKNCTFQNCCKAQKNK